MPRPSKSDQAPPALRAAIGERLRKERDRLGVTQEALAEHFEVRRQAVLLYESGERSPLADQLAAFAELGGDATYVLTGHRHDGLSAKARADLQTAMAAVDDVCRATSSNLDGSARLKLALEMLDGLYRTNGNSP